MNLTKFCIIRSFIFGIVFIMTRLVFAAGPEQIASSDRSLWQDDINSDAGFNRASRAEILVFSAALSDFVEKSDSEILEILHIHSLDRESILRIQKKLSQQLINNYKNAQETCTTEEPFCVSNVSAFTDLVSAGRDLGSKIPMKYRKWYDNAHTFHVMYVHELIRLAALFPKISSEVDTFNNSELNGFELHDKHFLLTFDDGPTKVNGSTDKLLVLLRQNNLNGIFYMLGERLKERLTEESPKVISQKYEGQCVAIHGWKHESHQRWSSWQSSILDTQDLLQNVLGNIYRPYFRPPYGQRLKDSAEFFSNHHLKVALWNIDSQDWHPKISTHEVSQRIITLMLLWRHGVILFHDVHIKVQDVIPVLLSKMKNSGIVWSDCRTY